MSKRTKIVATIGPSSESREVLDAIIRAGVDVVRLNFSHGSHAAHAERARIVRECASAQGRHVAVLGDLQGPKIRTERFVDGKVELAEGDLFTLDADCPPNEGTQERVGITYKQLVDDVREGDTLILDDGRIILGVERVTGHEILTRVVSGGVLSNNKGINRLGGGLSAHALTAKDREDMRAATEIDVDYIAVSFPRSASDIEEARAMLKAAGSGAKIVAKIERAEAIHNIDEIIDASDVIMIARGDLGVEIGDAELPSVQKAFIKRARAKDKIVITATQMMESMISSPIPTRAEVFDVANAVIDGTDAVMLSAETAAGQYPVKVVEAMARICARAEGTYLEKITDYRIGWTFDRVDEGIAMSAMYAANHVGADAIIALTESGNTARWMSRIDSKMPIFGVTRQEKTARLMALYKGVTPIFYHFEHGSALEVTQRVISELVRRGSLHAGMKVVMTKGDAMGEGGKTNMLKVMRVGDYIED